MDKWKFKSLFLLENLVIIIFKNCYYFLPLDISSDDKTPVASPSSFTDYQQQSGLNSGEFNNVNKIGNWGFV